ncbi:MAG: hypothetical protein R3D30_01050 [Hyphomicrobiales bacterium]
MSMILRSRDPVRVWREEYARRMLKLDCLSLFPTSRFTQPSSL